MKRIKAFLYNNNIDNVCVLLFVVIGIVICFCLKKEIYIWLICLIGLVAIFLHKVVDTYKHKDLKYIVCSQSILKPNYVWINQIARKKRGNTDKCPQEEFVREMKKVLENLNEGTVCFCCTHDLIKKHIKKKYPKADIIEVYNKDLRKLKKIIKSKKCDTCGRKNKCSLFKSEKTQFYAIKFVNEKTSHQN